MITAFNALLECLVTGLFTALFIYGMTRIGMLPLMLLTYKDPYEEEDIEEDEQPPSL